MKKLLIGSLLLWGAVCSGAQAVTLHVAGGKLTGASGVEVDGVLYDVEFRDGTCIALFDGCDSASDFTFKDETSAKHASQALLDSVFIDQGDSTQAYDTNPALTAGCGFPGECVVVTPYSVAISPPSPLSTITAYNEDIIATDAVFLTTLSRSTDTGPHLDVVFAVWTIAEVPEPSTVLLLTSGALGLLVRRPRRRRT